LKPEGVNNSEVQDMSETVTVTQDMGIARLFFNRPAFYNAFDFDTINQFANLLIALAVDNSVRGIVISGEGKALRREIETYIGVSTWTCRRLPQVSGKLSPGNP
jgi:1,4-dihydroxy-2-naphthoyl-CoA synthase